MSTSLRNLLVVVSTTSPEDLHLAWTLEQFAGNGGENTKRVGGGAVLEQYFPAGISWISFAVPSIESTTLALTVKRYSRVKSSSVDLRICLLDHNGASSELTFASLVEDGEFSHRFARSLVTEREGAHGTLDEERVAEAAKQLALQFENQASFEQFSSSVQLVPDERVVQSSTVFFPEPEENTCATFVDTDVWFATNRCVVSRPNETILFSDDVGPVSTGHCTVRVPIWHRPMGALKSPLWRRLIFGDDSIRILDTTLLENSEFWADLNFATEDNEPLDRSVLVFLHGFNTSFNAAICRSAQLAVDLEVTGPVAAFCWPSLGSIRQYSADADRIQTSALAFREFLQALAEKSGATRINIIAHSMGSRALARALESLKEMQTVIPLGQIILAAPDLSKAEFSTLAVAYKTLSQRTTVYISDKDHALWMSEVKNLQERLGFGPPIDVHEGIDSIYAGAIPSDFLGHGYAVEARPLLTDIHTLLRSNESPSTRFGMVQHSRGYWSLRA